MRNGVVVVIFLAIAGATSAAQITFTSGNPAVAVDVNANFTELYNAKWTLSGSDLSWSTGNVGIGLAPTASTRLTVHAAKNTLHQLIGDSASATGAPNTDVFAAMAFYGNGIKHAQIHYRPTLGNGTLVFGGSTAAANVLGVGQSLDVALAPNGGNVGVGVVSPTVKFQVDGGTAVTLGGATGYGIFGASGSAHTAISTTQIQAKANTAAAADLFVNPLGGNVGINTGSLAPSNALEVANFGATAVRGIASTHYSSDITNGLVTARKARGTPSAPAAILSGDQLGVFSMQGYDGSGFAGSAWVLALANENWTGSAHGTRMVIATTANGSTTTTTRVRIEDNGDVAIGNVAPSVALHIVGAACSTVASGFNACASDRRLKQNFSDLSDALTPLLKLKVKAFDWNNEAEKHFGYKDGQHDLGLIAQEVEAIDPAWVSLTPAGYKRINEGFLKFYALRAIQQLHEMGVQQKAETSTQILALQKRALDAEQKLSVAVSQSNRDRQAAEARAEKLERLLVAESQARKQQEIRLAQLEESLVRVAKRIENQRQVVARK